MSNAIPERLVENPTGLFRLIVRSGYQARRFLIAFHSSAKVRTRVIRPGDESDLVLITVLGTCRSAGGRTMHIHVLDFSDIPLGALDKRAPARCASFHVTPAGKVPEPAKPLDTMNQWPSALLKLCSGAYFLIASLYCFLAYIPYTFFFVIVNPPFQWLNTFAHYNLLLLWVAAAAATISSRSHRAFRLLAIMEFGLAMIASIYNPISNIHNNWTALAWSIGFLLPVLITNASGFAERAAGLAARDSDFSIAFYDAGFVGFLCAMVSIVSLRLHSAMHGGLMIVQWYDAELMLWVIIEHATLAIAIACLINLIRSALCRVTANPLLTGVGVVGLVVFIGLSAGCLFFVEDSLSLHGWTAWVYAILLAAAISFLGLEVLVPLVHTKAHDRLGRRLLAIAAITLVLLAIYGSLAVDPSDDWNGIFHQTLTLLLWVVVAICIFELRSSRKQYSARTVLAVALATCVSYEALNYSKPVWAADVGASGAQILHEMGNYSALNTSFELVDKLLGNGMAEPCDTTCKTLRQYSNVRNAKIPRELKLVDSISPTAVAKPNIFIFVIDSLRTDYLGVYNPRVDFTPNIDEFAKNSAVMRHAYTDYAGTSLSEPSIWSGALLLHAHYAQPFQNVNSLEKLARADGYQIVISYDEVLRQLIAPSEDIIQLDTETKMWGEMELSSTLAKLEKVLDHRSPQAGPVFFYTQPMNVHMHGTNNLPKRTQQNWQSRPGFDDRIAYALHQVDGFLGDFFSYLKSKNILDDSMIILTSDHGDATGELGRLSHSMIIYPEVMHVPLIVHLPQSMRNHYVYDEDRMAALIDIAPTLYYLLGHRPIKENRLAGRPIFMDRREEFLNYPRSDLFLASDSIAAFGILAENGRWMYTTYDSPSRSMLFDLAHDATAQHDVLTPDLKKQYDARVLQYLQWISDFYGYHPTGGS